MGNSHEFSKVFAAPAVLRVATADIFRQKFAQNYSPSLSVCGHSLNVAVHRVSNFVQDAHGVFLFHRAGVLVRAGSHSLHYWDLFYLIHTNPLFLQSYTVNLLLESGIG